MSMTLKQKDLMAVLERRYKSAVVEYQFDSTPPAEKALALANVAETLMELSVAVSTPLGAEAKNTLAAARHHANEHRDAIRDEVRDLKV